MRERWAKIPGWPYEASDQGRVRRATNGGGTWAGRVIKGSLNAYGYPRFELCKNGTRKQEFVHRAVWRAHAGKIPANKQINHKNGVKTDNRLRNLELVSVAENLRHAREIGLADNRGENSGHAKLSNEQVLAIRAMRKYGLPLTYIAKQFDTNHSHVSRICLRKVWKHI